jgi:hypothetical protein
MELVIMMRSLRATTAPREHLLSRRKPSNTSWSTLDAPEIRLGNDALSESVVSVCATVAAPDDVKERHVSCRVCSMAFTIRRATALRIHDVRSRTDRHAE